MNTRRVIGLIATVPFYSLPLLADTSVHYSQGGGNQPSAVYVTDNKLRVDHGSGGNWMLFDRTANAIYMVEPAEQRYTVIDQATIEQLGGVMASANRQMEEVLKNLPPEQRAQMRAMMKQQMQGMLNQQGASFETRATGRSDRVAGMSCDIVETWQGEQKHSELCVADAGAIDMSAGEQQTLRELGTFAESMVNSIQRQAGDLFPEGMIDLSSMEQLTKGVPLRVVEFQGGSRTEVERISHDRVSAELLSVPAGYQRQQLDPQSAR